MEKSNLFIFEIKEITLGKLHVGRNVISKFFKIKKIPLGGKGNFFIFENKEITFVHPDGGLFIFENKKITFPPKVISLFFLNKEITRWWEKGNFLILKNKEITFPPKVISLVFQKSRNYLLAGKR